MKKAFNVFALAFTAIILAFAVSCSDDGDDNPIVDQDPPVERGKMKMTITNSGGDWAPGQTIFTPEATRDLFDLYIKFDSPFEFSLTLDRPKGDNSTGAFSLSNSHKMLIIGGPDSTSLKTYQATSGVINITSLTDSTIKANFDGITLDYVNDPSIKLTINDAELDLDIKDE